MYGFFLILGIMKEINQIQFVETHDGSKTIYQEEIGEHYHSRHGAVGESRHVFVGMGLEHVLQGLSPTDQCVIRILEVGFGTGLNFLMSASFLNKLDRDRDRNVRLDYLGIEAFPLSAQTLEMLNYKDLMEADLWNSFIQTYPSTLQDRVPITSNVHLQILPQKIMETSWSQEFDLIYFDAFSATHQPEMWTLEVLAHVTRNLVRGGVFVTYSITGDLKRSLKSLGFTIERLPGAPGKREMLRATKAV